jgi:hypothetical protein
VDAFLVASLIGCVSLLYATAGQAGGTAFLAIMAFAAFPAIEMRATALLLNIVAAAYATWRLHRRGAIDPKLLLPLTAPSLVTAFAGGLLVLAGQAYFILTGLLLIAAAVLMVVRRAADAGVALVGACLMVASGVLPLADAYKAIDIDTITLLLGMMIIVANLRLSGFFAVITNWVMRHMHRPLTLLGAVTRRDRREARDLADGKREIACDEDDGRRQLVRRNILARHDERHSRHDERECHHADDAGDGKPAGMAHDALPPCCCRAQSAAADDEITPLPEGSRPRQLRVSGTPSQKVRKATMAQPARKRNAAE